MYLVLGLPLTWTFCTAWNNTSETEDDSTLILLYHLHISQVKNSILQLSNSINIDCVSKKSPLCVRL